MLKLCMPIKVIIMETIIAEDNKISMCEIKFILKQMKLSDNNLLFTVEQFREFSRALNLQFPSTNEKQFGLKSFNVYPLNNGIEFSSLCHGSTHLSLPYIS